ncbi:preprotein translocase subunit SecE [Dissulfurirhabdus thermomarina]|uniref:Protein translocase subunit SecE n=1 Tax=Dissulfurirhabdus thermomarina TaxID=1765737 RepID=A0A6N9TRF6_DISTH|nr:preprotein translocase subunit SecE [Dissulfurirhabdus thermomarina]NDY42334.1 preprotein translocase subunit SecE [Dissulfurirhabdus thermomarina]NMX23401.1 preprotein translocase subunit SecE [Dissulfurirhabdus thermomarina]
MGTRKKGGKGKQGRARKGRAAVSDRRGAAPAAPAKAKTASPARPGVGWVQATLTFLREVRAEFEKVTFATRKETLALTAAVLAITFFFTAYLGLTDLVLSWLITKILY